MDTVIELTFYGREQLLEQAETRTMELESLFSVTDSGSEIYAVNHNRKAALSADTASLLSTRLGLCQRTRGALDLSVYPIVRAWGFTTNNYRVPEKSELSELMEHVDYTQIAFDQTSGSVTLGPQMEIDLGSIAKGYTGNQLIELFRNNGVSSAMLNLGGNVQVLGGKPDGSPWRVAIKDPAGEGTLGVLNGNVTREQFVTMLWRLFGEPAADSAASFTDSANVSGYAKTAVDWAVSQGIISGYTDGSFGPQKSATRAEVAKMLTVFCTNAEG